MCLQVRLEDMERQFGDRAAFALQILSSLYSRTERAAKGGQKPVQHALSAIITYQHAYFTPMPDPAPCPQPPRPTARP